MAETLAIIPLWYGMVWYGMVWRGGAILMSLNSLYKYTGNI